MRGMLHGLHDKKNTTMKKTKAADAYKEPNRTISKKKASALYNLLHEEIMETRIKLSIILKTHHKFDRQIYDEVDAALSKLNMSVPASALRFFEKP